MNPDQLRALSILAASPNGCIEATLIAQGFTVDSLVELIEAGLVSAKTRRVIISRSPIEVRRFHITEAGREAIERGRNHCLQPSRQGRYRSRLGFGGAFGRRI